MSAVIENGNTLTLSADEGGNSIDSPMMLMLTMTMQPGGMWLELLSICPPQFLLLLLLLHLLLFCEPICCATGCHFFTHFTAMQLLAVYPQGQAQTLISPIDENQLPECVFVVVFIGTLAAARDQVNLRHCTLSCCWWIHKTSFYDRNYSALSYRILSTTKTLAATCFTFSPFIGIGNNNRGQRTSTP